MAKKRVVKTLPSPFAEGDVKRLWIKARRGESDARRQLHELVVGHPASVVPLIRKFVAQRELDIRAAYGTPRVKKAESGWQRALERSGRYTVLLSGGLPTLGKRR